MSITALQLPGYPTISSSTSTSDSSRIPASALIFRALSYGELRPLVRNRHFGANSAPPSLVCSTNLAAPLFWHHSSRWYLLHLCHRMEEGNEHIPWLGNEQMFGTGKKQFRSNFHGSSLFPFPGTNSIITTMPTCYSNTKKQKQDKIM